MNKLAEKFGERFSSFWDKKPEAEKSAVLAELLEYANANPSSFRRDLKEIQFDFELFALPVVLEALAADTQNWGDLYVEVLNDILTEAPNAAKPGLILSLLGEFAYIQMNNRPFVQKIADRLFKELNSDNQLIVRAAIDNLTDFLENPSIKNKQAMLSALQQKLYDANWKVRCTAFIALGFEDHLPAGFKLSFIDKLLKLFFWRTFV